MHKQSVRMMSLNSVRVDDGVIYRYLSCPEPGPLTAHLRYSQHYQLHYELGITFGYHAVSLLSDNMTVIGFGGFVPRLGTCSRNVPRELHRIGYPIHDINTCGYSQNRQI